MLRPRKSVGSLPAYRSPILSQSELNLDLNENTSGCSLQVLAKLQALTGRELSRYPDRRRGEKALAEFWGVDPQTLLLTNGVDEGLFLLFAAYIDTGDEVIFADPTFMMYSVYAEGLGGRVTKIPSRQNFEFPAAEVLAKISDQTRLVAIANPNNPTGLASTKADLMRIVEAAPNAAILMDEAYFEFHGESLLDDVARHDNLFVARTFSKAYGLAGLRLGAIAGPSQQIGYLRGFCSPFNVNAVAIECLEAALGDREFVERHVAEIAEGRDRLSQLCGELNLPFWPSRTNFVLVRVGDSAAFVQALAQLGIQVRDASGIGCQGCVRITIGTHSEMDTLLASIREIVRVR